MASQGRYKQLSSTSPLLEVKRAGKDHHCAGIAVERGNRPGKLKDVWVTGKSKRCLNKIKHGQLYVANRIVPPTLLTRWFPYDQWIPTCPVCAIETYPEFFEGEGIATWMRPMSPELRRDIKEGLAQILTDIEMAAS